MPTAAYIREWKRKNPEKVKASRLREYTNRRARVLAAYGGRCACCSEGHVEFLAIDHIAGGGAEHRKRVGPHRVVLDIVRRDFPPEYQLLCHNCNSSKGFYGYCPHRPDVKLAKRAVGRPRQDGLHIRP